MMRNSWPLGWLILQAALSVLLIATCFGTLGIEGMIGALIVLGVAALLWTVVNATGRRGRRRH